MLSQGQSPRFIYEPPTTPLYYHHVDDDLLVLEKPSGLLSVPGKADDHGDCVEARVRADHLSATIVHRLDLDTSGLMIMALNIDAHRNLSAQFQRREIEKRYIAKVWDRPMSDNGTITLPLRCNWPQRPKQMVDFTLGKAAETRWQVLASDGKTSLIALSPKTGRSHQLRVHMASIGCPILGDRFYAHDEALAMSKRLLLHAERLAFKHPVTGTEMVFESKTGF
ncbi:MAG: pseudouridine synthase [Pseudomonadota bacterium]